MNIFITSSTKYLMKNYDFFIKYKSFIKSSGHEITDDWFAEARKNISRKVNVDSQEIYLRKIHAIETADLVIAEGAKKSFTVGHHISLALLKSIPVLFVYNKEAIAENSYLEGIVSKWLLKESYKNLSELEEITTNFIGMYAKDSKKRRLQLVLTQAENTFLEEQMKLKGTTKTNIIRQLIQKEILKN